MASRYGDSPNRNNRQPGPRWGRVFGITLSIVLALVIVGVVVVYAFGHNLISLTNYVSKQQVQPVVNKEDLPEEAKVRKDPSELQGAVLNESELDSIHQMMNEVDDKMEMMSNEDVYNLLLVGVDRRDKTWNGNSDSMILVSINFKKERISMISIMRDTYVNIPEVGYNKLNNSYARGGGDLLCATVTDSFNLDVSRYAAVDYEDMIEIVDALGGIDLEWTDAEVEVANGYMLDMCRTLGIDFMSEFLPGAGTYHCDGIQAVAYARNRFVGNSDYARTERQRYVISKILERVKELNIAELMNFARKCLPLITHNVKESEIWELITKAPTILGYDLVKDRVPYDNMYDIIQVDGEDMLVPQWQETISKMHETIYGDGSISGNADNNEKDRTKNNNVISDDYEEVIKRAEAEKAAREQETADFEG